VAEGEFAKGEMAFASETALTESDEILRGVERRQYQSRPDRYEYVLTERGRDVGLVMLARVQVGDKWNLDELEGPPLRLVDSSTGHGVKLALVDAKTGVLVNPANLKIEPGPGADELMKWRLARRTRKN
jgi:hypothetical protein